MTEERSAPFILHNTYGKLQGLAAFLLARCRVYQSARSTPTPSRSRATSSANGACSKIVPAVPISMLLNGAR
jgi:hypothetical protein